MKAIQKIFKVALLACLAGAYIATAPGQSPTRTPVAVTPTPTPVAVTPTVIQPKVIEDPGVPTGWKRYQLGDEPAFSVILPSPPKVSSQPTSATSIAHLYFSNTDTAVYGAVRLTGLGQDMDRATESERQTYFRNYIEGFAKGFQESINKDSHNYELKLLDTKNVRVAGHDGFQQDLTVGPFQGSSQLVFAGSEAFCVLSIWNPQTPAADREAFFKSFQLPGPPK